MEVFQKAGGIMTKSNFVIVTPKTKVFDVALAIINGEVSGIPVVDDDKKVVGIITEFDIIRARVTLIPFFWFIILVEKLFLPFKSFRYQQFLS